MCQANANSENIFFLQVFTTTARPSYTHTCREAGLSAPFAVTRQQRQHTSLALAADSHGKLDRNKETPPFSFSLEDEYLFNRYYPYYFACIGQLRRLRFQFLPRLQQSTLSIFEDKNRNGSFGWPLSLYDKVARFFRSDESAFNLKGFHRFIQD